MTFTYYDRDGTPITQDEWMQKMEDWAYRLVMITDIGEHRISTIWLGLDHDFLLTGVPMIFETVIFSDDGLDQQMWRYATEAQAIAGHDQVVALCRERAGVN